MKRMRDFLLILLLSCAAVTFAADKEKSALLIALESGDTPGVVSAIEDGANIEEEYHFGWKPIMVAIFEKNLEAVKLLIKAGASPNASDQLGESALHVSMGGPIEIAEALLSAGANVNVQNAGGITPLMLAASAGNKSMVQLLLSKDASPAFVDYEGKSAIGWAEGKGNDEIAQLLRKSLAPNNQIQPTQ